MPRDIIQTPQDHGQGGQGGPDKSTRWRRGPSGTELRLDDQSWVGKVNQVAAETDCDHFQQ